MNEVESGDLTDASKAVTICTASIIAIFLCISTAWSLLNRPPQMELWQALVPAIVGILTLLITYVGMYVWNPFVYSNVQEADESSELTEVASSETIRILVLFNAVAGIVYVIVPYAIPVSKGQLMVAEAVATVLVYRFLSRTWFSNE